MSTIGTLAASIALDTTKFTEGATLTRRELQKVGQVMDSLKTPAERLAGEIDHVTDLMIRGGLSADAALQHIINLQTGYDNAAESARALAEAEQTRLAIAAIQEQAAEQEHFAQIAEQSSQTVQASYRGMFETQKSGFAEWMAGSRGATAVLGGTVAAAGLLAKVYTDNTRAAASFVDEMQDVAKNLELTNSQTQGLALAADTMGTNFATVEGSIRKLQLTIGQGVGGDKGANGIFGKLGLNAATLQEMGTFEAFTTVLDKISQLETAEQRAAAAAEVFGKQGAKMGELLAAGASGVAAAVSDVEKFGAVNEAQAQAIEDNIDAGKRLSAAWSGIWQQQAAEGAGFTAQLKGWAASWLESFNAPIAARANFQRQMEEMDKALADERAKSAAALNPAAPAAMSQEAIDAYFEDANKARSASRGSGAIDSMASLQKQIEQFGMTAGEKLADDIAKANPAFAERAKLLADQLALLEANKQAADEAAAAEKRAAHDKEQETERLKDQGEALTKALETPVEEFLRKRDEIEALFAGGFIDDRTFDRAIQRVQRELHGDAQRNRKKADMFSTPRFAAAAERDSQAAFQAERSARAMQTLTAMSRKHIALAERQARAAEQTSTDLKTLVVRDPVA